VEASRRAEAAAPLIRIRLLAEEAAVAVAERSRWNRSPMGAAAVGAARRPTAGRR